MLLMILSELVKTRSSMLPLICVGSLTSCERLLLKRKSQNKLEIDVEVDSESQLISGKLKSPTTIRLEDVYTISSTDRR